MIFLFSVGRVMWLLFVCGWIIWRMILIRGELRCLVGERKGKDMFFFVMWGVLCLVVVVDFFI